MFIHRLTNHISHREVAARTILPLAQWLLIGQRFTCLSHWTIILCLQYQVSYKLPRQCYWFHTLLQKKSSLLDNKMLVFYLNKIFFLKEDTWTLQIIMTTLTFVSVWQYQQCDISEPSSGLIRIVVPRRKYYQTLGSKLCDGFWDLDPNCKWRGTKCMQV